MSLQAGPYPLQPPGLQPLSSVSRVPPESCLPPAWFIHADYANPAIPGHIGPATCYEPDFQAGIPAGPGAVPPPGPPGLPPGRKRGTANRKERRRTQSINSAFAELRECIPNVPADTKLSKIKTLRLATSYIAYLTEVLARGEVAGGGFRADIRRSEARDERRRRELQDEIQKGVAKCNERKSKGRSGWPQHVWALEFQQ
uniref:heart- and neural crest derivatives-expressed protein 2-like n=1 Tax=Myxine glutinosa TaxID=7769 RepID=UPI00358E69A1